jgi:purine-binding chemotaxis protein CheW
MDATEALAATQQFLTFRIGEETYAVGVLTVREILQLERITGVPRTPPWIRGVINLRGSVVPVVDLGIKFGLPPSVPTPASCVVILETGVGGEKTVMGVLADAVDQVVDLAEDDILPPPSFGTRVRVDFLVGMGRGDQGFVLILDIERVLSTEELLTVEAATSEAPLDEEASLESAGSAGDVGVPRSEDDRGGVPEQGASDETRGRPQGPSPRRRKDLDAAQQGQ